MKIRRDDAEAWLSEVKDIWHHPYISDRTNENAYELADLMAEFANFVIENKETNQKTEPMQ